MCTNLRLIFRCFLVLLAATLAGSCSRPAPEAAETENGLFRYASWIRMYDCGGYQKAVIRNPWDTTRTLHTYLLVARGDTLPPHSCEGTVVRVPLQRAVAFSGVHAGLMQRLGCVDALAGVCDTDYLMDSLLLRAVAGGRLADFGSSLSPNVEQLLRSDPDALLVSPFENSGGYGVVDRLRIPLVECADYMETSALGRAEWMRFYGRLFGRAAEADSLFALVERNYLHWKALAAQSAVNPLLLTDRMEGASWYVAGGQSTLGCLYADAGARYAFASHRRTGSVRLTFESVYRAARDADLWIIKYGQATDLTYAQLEADYRPNTGFRPWRERRIYGCNTMRIPFYEEEPFRPDLLLADLVRLLHPDLHLPDAPLRYFSPLHEK